MTKKPQHQPEREPKSQEWRAQTLQRLFAEKNKTIIKTASSTLEKLSQGVFALNFTKQNLEVFGIKEPKSIMFYINEQGEIINIIIHEGLNLNRIINLNPKDETIVHSIVNDHLETLLQKLPTPETKQEFKGEPQPELAKIQGQTREQVKETVLLNLHDTADKIATCLPQNSFGEVLSIDKHDENVYIQTTKLYFYIVKNLAGRLYLRINKSFSKFNKKIEKAITSSTEFELEYFNGKEQESIVNISYWINLKPPSKPNDDDDDLPLAWSND